jgi:large subunit ribosomal protein L18
MKKRDKKLYSQEKKRYLKKIIGNFERPRLAIFRSHKHIYAQLIDDKNGFTLLSSSTLEKTFPSSLSTSTKSASYEVGLRVGQKALEKNFKSIIFDRGIRPYHGRIQSLAEGARKAGLQF